MIKALNSMSGVENFDMNVNSGVLLVKSSLPISVIQEKIESIGPRVVVKGYGTESQPLQGKVCYSLLLLRLFYLLFCVVIEFAVQILRLIARCINCVTLQSCTIKYVTKLPPVLVL